MNAVTLLNKPKLEVKKQKAYLSDHGRYPDREHRRFLYTGYIGGQKFEVSVSRRTQFYIGPGKSRYSRGHYFYERRSYDKKPVIYFTFANESVFEDFAHRESRPVTLMGKTARQLLKLIWGDDAGKIGWNIHAGCGMCPCSPGFIWGPSPAIDFEDGNGPTRRYDVNITVDGMPRVDTDPKKQARMHQRAAAINGDPTIPVTLEAVPLAVG